MSELYSTNGKRQKGIQVFGWKPRGRAHLQNIDVNEKKIQRLFLTKHLWGVERILPV
jgi:hypothetical protein